MPASEGDKERRAVGSVQRAKRDLSREIKLSASPFPQSAGCLVSNRLRPVLCADGCGRQTSDGTLVLL